MLSDDDGIKYDFTQHGVLHRKQTLANGGEYCDYFITGNRE